MKYLMVYLLNYIYSKGFRSLLWFIHLELHVYFLHFVLNPIIFQIIQTAQQNVEKKSAGIKRKLRQLI